MLIDFKDEDFDNKIKNEDVSVIQFSAAWCGPCKALKPVMDKLAGEYKEKWWTVSAFYSECDEIRENEDKMFSFKSVDEKLKFLDGINEYVMNLEQKYSDA